MFFQDIVDYFSDAVKVAGYIDSFLDNQIDLFKEWVTFRAEDALYDMEREKEREKEEKEKFCIDIAACIMV